MRRLQLHALNDEKGGKFEAVKSLDGSQLKTDLGTYVEAYFLESMGIVGALPGHYDADKDQWSDDVPVYGYKLEIVESRVHPPGEQLVFKVSNRWWNKLMETFKKGDYLRMRSTFIEHRRYKWHDLVINDQMGTPVGLSQVPPRKATVA